MTRKFIIGFAFAIVFDLMIQGVKCRLNHQPRACWMGMPIEMALELSKKEKP